MQRRRLFSSAQVVTDVPVTLTAVKLHEEVAPGAQCVCIRGYIYIGPHLLLANTQRVPPPPRGAEERIGRPRWLPGQY
jgi:hypothetical protein